MHPEKYVKRFRLIATISWVGFGLLAIVLMLISIAPRHIIVPIAAVAIGTIPLIVFKLSNKVECPRCKYKMKIYSNFPHVIYKCTRCSHIVNTSVYTSSS